MARTSSSWSRRAEIAQLSVENEPGIKGALHRKDAKARKSVFYRLVGTADCRVFGNELEALAAGLDEARRYVRPLRQQVVDSAFDIFQCTALNAVPGTHLPLP